MKSLVIPGHLPQPVLDPVLAVREDAAQNAGHGRQTDGRDQQLPQRAVLAAEGRVCGLKVRV